MLARSYDYGRKTQNDDDVDYGDDYGVVGGSDYFTRGEGSRNFTFGGRAVEERAPVDDDDEDDDDDDDDEDEDDSDDGKLIETEREIFIKSASYF